MKRSRKDDDDDNVLGCMTVLCTSVKVNRIGCSLNDEE